MDGKRGQATQKILELPDFPLPQQAVEDESKNIFQSNVQRAIQSGAKQEDMEQKIELLQKLMQDVRVMSVFEADNTKITHNLTRTDLEILKQLIENTRKRIEQL